MIKTICLLFFILFIPSLIYAQLFPYNSREWDTNWIYTKFSDSFTGTLLDKTKWEVVKDYGRGKCVFVDSEGTTYSVNNGLSLSMIYHPGYCYNDGTNHCPDYISAEIVSREKFKYGIYEGRMKFATGEGSWPAFWFYGGSGADDPKYNTGYASEIDIAEYNWRKKEWPSGGYYVHTDHVFHWWWPQSIYGTREMNIYDGIKNNYIAWNTSHTFKLIYTPYDIKFYIDGILNWRRSRFYTIVDNLPVDIFIENMNGSTQYPENEWFPKHEGQIILSQQVSGNVWDGDVSAPQTSLFEWVTYKKFFLSPEITVPSYICSTGTATLDVDPLASNITWQLTPSSLFATSSGTGKTANIVKAPVESGMGKITYTFQMPGGETFTAEKSFRIGLTGSFTGSASVAYKGTGIWNAVASCGTTPYTFEWWLREEGTGVEAQLVATGSQLRLLSVPRTTMAANQQDVKTDTNPIINQPVTYTYYDLYLRVVDGNGVKYIEYTTPEQRIIASGNVDLVSRSPNRMADGLTEPDNGILINAFPNPTGSETTIELAGTKIDSMNVSTTWDMEVYDPYSMLKTKANKIQGKTFKINTSDWKDGVYVLRAKVNDEIITEKLFVKH